MASLSTSPATTLESRVVAKVIWRLVPLLIILMAINQIDRTNIGLAALTMNQDLGITPYMFGWAAGIFAIGYILFELPSNMIMVRVPPNVWIGSIALAWGIVASSMAFIHSANALYVMRFLLGIAEAGFIPGATYYFLCWIPLKQRAKATAIWFTGTWVAPIIGAPLAGFLLQLNGRLGFAGWQWLFLLEGIPAIVMAFVTFALLTPTPEEASWLAAEERTWLTSALAGERSAIRSEPHTAASLARTLSSWRVWVLGVLYIGILMSLFVANTWLPTIIKSIGSLEIVSVLAVIAVIWAIAGAVSIWWGRHSDRHNERYVHLSISLFCGAAGLLISAFTPPAIAILGLALAVSSILSALTIFWVIPGTFLTGVGAAAGIAVINTLGNFGGFVGPFVVGWIKQETGSFSNALAILAGALIVSGVIAVAIRPQRAVSNANLARTSGA